MNKEENNVTENTQEISTQSTKSPLCQVNCKTCNSPHLIEIHKKRLSDQLTFRELSAYILKEYGESISHSALHSHFQNFHKYMREQVEDRMIVYLNKEVDKRAEHSAKLITLIDAMFDDVAIAWPQIPKTIDNLDKLIKIHIAVKNGTLPMGDFDEQLQSLVQHAENVNVNQLCLFSPAPPLKDKQENSEKNNE